MSDPQTLKRKNHDHTYGRPVAGTAGRTQSDPGETPRQNREKRPRRRIAAQAEARPQEAPKGPARTGTGIRPGTRSRGVPAAPEAYDPAPALSAPCSEPCPETCSAPAAETAELAEETPLTTAVMPESPVMADSLTHGQRVAAIAATLFQDLAALHGLDDVWGHRLHLAAQLHDIGVAEGRKGHHKISMRLIEEDLSLNIHEDDRPWVALLARYHRKAWPSRRHARFDALKKSDRKALRKAASLLRIADALDYTHTGVVGNLAVAVKKRKVIIAVQCSGDCSAEMERVIKKGDLFMHVFGRELECVCQGN